MSAPTVAASAEESTHPGSFVVYVLVDEEGGQPFEADSFAKVYLQIVTQ